MKEKRSRKIVFISHCLVNQNAKAAGFAQYPGIVSPLVRLLDKHGAGIVQMPCPEEAVFGIGRPAGEDSKQFYDTAAYRRNCRAIAGETIGRIMEYRKNGYRVLCILGVDGSPSCGVACAPVRKGSGTVMSREKGLFTDILSAKLKESGIRIPIIGIPESERSGDLDRVLDRLEKIISSGKG